VGARELGTERLEVGFGLHVLEHQHLGVDAQHLGHPHAGVAQRPQPLRLEVAS
jgi:hypothetical protein